MGDTLCESMTTRTVAASLFRLVDCDTRGAAQTTAAADASSGDIHLENFNCSRRRRCECALWSASARSVSSGRIAHRHHARSELETAHERQVEGLREPREQHGPMPRDPGMHHELVLVDQSELRQGQREREPAHEQSVPRFCLELLHSCLQIPAHELRIPVDPLQGARYDVLPLRIDGAREGLHPLGSRSRRHGPAPSRLHHLVRHPSEKERIGLLDVLDRVTMQSGVGDHRAMIAAPVQRDVDGITKRLHGDARALSLPRE